MTATTPRTSRRLTRALNAQEQALQNAQAQPTPTETGTPAHHTWSQAWTLYRHAAINVAVIQAQETRRSRH